MSTISNSVSYSVTLGTGTFTSPLTITSTGAVSNNGTADAVIGPGTQAWTVDNAGTVTATGAHRGIAMLLGGYVDNSGQISGGAGGVYIGGAAGTVVNTGRIIETGTRLAAVYLDAGGRVDNTGTGALISGYGGVYIFTAAGAVTNAGTIIATGSFGD